MPRNVRNFWLELTVDGAVKRIETGPRSKDGGFELSILMRDEGGIKRAMELRGYAKDDGSLHLMAEVTSISLQAGRQPVILSVETKR